MHMNSPLTMILLNLTTAVMCLAGTGPSTLPGDLKTFTLNNAVGQNTISFLSEAPQENFTGTADNLTGTFMMSRKNPELTKGKLKVVVRSMKTAIARRDEHMYSAVWLDADKYPEITFEIAGLKDVTTTVKEGKHITTATTVGTFSCHGITKPLTANVIITYLPENSETRKRASGDLVMIKATFDVILSDFNITGKPGLIGSCLGEVMHITADVFANSLA